MLNNSPSGNVEKVRKIPGSTLKVNGVNSRLRHIPPSKFRENLFSKFLCNPAAKPTLSKQTGERRKSISISNLEAVCPPSFYCRCHRWISISAKTLLILGCRGGLAVTRHTVWLQLPQLDVFCRCCCSFHPIILRNVQTPMATIWLSHDWT